jgi:sporulation protein YunB
MRRFRRFRLPGGRWMVWALFCILGLYLVVRVADGLVLGPLAVVAETEARLRAVDAINRLVIVRRTTSTAELIHFLKDEKGQITAMTVDTQAVSQVASDAAIVVHDEVQRLASNSFGVPIGLLTGSKILGASGPRIPVRMLPVGSVVIDVRQSFESAGINQTRHRIYLHATATVQVVVPFVSKEVQVTADLPVTETVLLGAVPNVYGANLGAVSLPIKP